MYIERFNLNRESNKKRYLYYIGLGYSDKAAAVLALLTYGGEYKQIADEYGFEKLFEKLYNLLSDTYANAGESILDCFLYNAPSETKNNTADKLPGEIRTNTYSIHREQLLALLDTLTSRERKVLELRFGLADGRSRTLEEAAKECGITRERVRQIEAKALRKMRIPARDKLMLRMNVGFEEPKVLYKVAETEELADGFSNFPESCASSFTESASEFIAPCCYEGLSTDSYESIQEQEAKSVFTSPSSTFRMTTNTASMGVVMNQIRHERYVDISQVRIEEVLNYFDYESKAPEEKFGIYTELLPKGNDKKILYIRVQAREENKEHQNIILLLDVSGSMMGNAETTQEAVAAVISKLKPGDIFSLVTYASEDRTVVKGYEIRSEEDKETLLAMLYGLEIYGCTYGSAGIETAYRIGEEYAHEGWSNQVILITDGDLNFGITEKGGLINLIEEKKKSNLFLSVIGTGLRNYKDDNLEALSKHGNGTYCAVNSLEDAEESVNRRYISLTNIIAKDVKAQVEFNPMYVQEHRLLGYENRQLNHEDFADDNVISEPYGSGGHGIALYEITMNTAEIPKDLKYQQPANDYNEICTVKVRYKEPLSDESKEISKVVVPDENGGSDAQLAYLLYCISEKLRGSDKLDEFDEQYLNVMLSSGFNKTWLENNGEKLKTFLEAYKKEEDESLLAF